MSGDAKVIVGLVTLGVVVVITDGLMHYTRSLEGLQEAPEVTPSQTAPIMDHSRLDDWHVLSGVDAGVAFTGATPDEIFAALMGG
jgi:hypothetical protein